MWNISLGMSVKTGYCFPDPQSLSLINCGVFQECNLSSWQEIAISEWKFMFGKELILKLHFQLKCPIFNNMCSSHDGTMFQNDSRCSFTMTLAQGDYCKQQQLDPQDPLCAQVTLVGRIERVSCIVPKVHTNLEVYSA